MIVSEAVGAPRFISEMCVPVRGLIFGCIIIYFLDISGRDSVVLWSFIDRWRGGWCALADIRDVLSCAWSDVWQHSIRDTFGRDSVLLWLLVRRLVRHG